MGGREKERAKKEQKKMRGFIKNTIN